MHRWLLWGAVAYAVGVVAGDAAPSLGRVALWAAWALLALAFLLRGARRARWRLAVLWAVLFLLGCRAMSERVATDLLRAPSEALVEARVAAVAQTRNGWRIELRDVRALSGHAPSAIQLWLASRPYADARPARDGTRATVARADTKPASHSLSTATTNIKPRARAPAVTNIKPRAPAPVTTRALNAATPPPTPTTQPPTVGAHIRTRLSLRPFAAQRNPGGTNARARARRRGLGATASLAAHEPWAEVRAPRFAARRALLEWRHRSAARLKAHGAGGGLLAALALGDRSGLPQSDRALASRGGVAHLLAVSGLHLALVAGAAFALATLLLGRLNFWRDDETINPVDNTKRKKNTRAHFKRAARGGNSARSIKSADGVRARKFVLFDLLRAIKFACIRVLRTADNNSPPSSRAADDNNAPRFPRAFLNFLARARPRHTGAYDRRVTALWAAALAACGYALLTGWNPPVQRALLFLLLLLAGAFAARVVSPAPRLAAAALGVLLWDPASLFEPGPQLSFVAVAALMLQRGEREPFAREGDGGGSRRRPCGLPQRDASSRAREALAHFGARVVASARGNPVVANAVSGARALLRSSASATAATAALVAHHIGVAAPLGWLANAVAIPVTGLLLLPLALLAAFVAGFEPPGAALFLNFAARVAEWPLAALRVWGDAVPTAPWCVVASVAKDLGARVCAAVPSVCEIFGGAGVTAASVDGVACSAGVGRVVRPGVLAFGVSCLLAVLTLRAERTLPRLLGAVCAVSALALLPPASAWPPPPRVVFFDVGWGDAVLLQGRAANVLVDAGSGGGGRDDGARVVLPALAALGVARLDLVVASHADRDHRGGLPSVLAALPVGALWLPQGSAGEPGFARVRAAARARGVLVQERGAGASWRRGDITLRGLWPPRNFEGTRNARSLVVRAELAGHTVLSMGDLDAAGEAALLAMEFAELRRDGVRADFTTTRRDGVRAANRFAATRRDGVREGAHLRASLLKLGHHGSRSSSSAPFLRAVAPRLAVVSAAARGRFGFPHPVVRARLGALAIPWAWTGRDGALLVGLDPFCVRAFAADAALASSQMCTQK